MEISASEIDLLCKSISSSIQEYSLSGVYSIQSGILLRLRHATKPEKLIAISSFATWITTKNISLPEASPFAIKTRDLIERERLLSVEQVGGERIARFAFQGRDEGEKQNLYAEFFAGGNQITTTFSGEDEIIIEVASPQRFRHRALAPGEKYQLPPLRGIALRNVSFESLTSALKENKPGGNISAIKWFGRSVGTSRKFVEEIFHRSRIDPDQSALELRDSDLEILANCSRDLLRDLEKSKLGNLLVPEIDDESLDSGKGEKQQSVDACAIVPHSWREIEKEGKGSVREFPSFGEALDEAQVQSLVFERRKKASMVIRAKAAELRSAITKQNSLLLRNRKISGELRGMGKEVMSDARAELSEDLLKKLSEYEIIAPDENTGGLRFRSEPRTFVSTLTARGAASRLFDEAKRLEDSNRKIEEIHSSLVSQMEQLESQGTQQEERAERKLVIERREREWYERYRWFLASDGTLVVGGRDSTSNSVIINRYLNKGECVFHADLHGSPFFVLKNNSGEPTEEIVREVAQATVSFSRAWKDELGSADAYWVTSEQVKKSAPTGEYLPRGSFFIEGKKNFVKHMKVELALGLMTKDKLPEHNQEEEKREGEQSLIVICGPDKSISSYCVSKVKISPGKERASSTAKKIKQLLIAKVKDQSLKELSKRISTDEIIRVLPSGNYKIILEKKQNN